MVGPGALAAVFPDDEDRPFDEWIPPEMLDEEIDLLADEYWAGHQRESALFPLADMKVEDEESDGKYHRAIIDNWGIPATRVQERIEELRHESEEDRDAIERP